MVLIWLVTLLLLATLAASQKNFPALTAADVEDPPVLPLTISNSLVSKVDSFKFLGSIISQDLKRESNILKKALQRMYFLRQLRKHGLPQELLAIFYTAAILLPPPLWRALQIPAHKNNQTQEQLLSLCHHSPELLISGVIPTLAIHLHITYFIIPICILHTTFLPCKGKRP